MIKSNTPYKRTAFVENYIFQTSIYPTSYKVSKYSVLPVNDTVIVLYTFKVVVSHNKMVILFITCFIVKTKMQI